jgi:hypothetical protein
METIPLRTLLREPLKVKRITRAGRPVQVTDRGLPLWVIQPAVAPGDPARKRREIEADLAEVLREPKADVSLSRTVVALRR